MLPADYGKLGWEFLIGETLGQKDRFPTTGLPYERSFFVDRFTLQINMNLKQWTQSTADVLKIYGDCNMKKHLWKDCDGGIITTELVLVASFVTAILIGGLGTLGSQINNEFVQLAEVVESARRGNSAETNVDPAIMPDSGIEIAGQIDTFIYPQAEGDSDGNL